MPCANRANATLQLLLAKRCPHRASYRPCEIRRTGQDWNHEGVPVNGLDAPRPARTDKPLLLQVLGITEAEYTARFCHPVQTGWRLTCTPRRKFEVAAS
jgi:hypothetical protein